VWKSSFGCIFRGSQRVLLASALTVIDGGKTDGDDEPPTAPAGGLRALEATGLPPRASGGVLCHL
jgi:hypothetical protein